MTSQTVVIIMLSLFTVEWCHRSLGVAVGPRGSEWIGQRSFHMVAAPPHQYLLAWKPAGSAADQVDLYSK